MMVSDPLPVPFAFDAVTVALNVPVKAGVPLIKPELLFTLSPRFVGFPLHYHEDCKGRVVQKSRCPLDQNTPGQKINRRIAFCFDESRN